MLRGGRSHVCPFPPSRHTHQPSASNSTSAATAAATTPARRRRRRRRRRRAAPPRAAAAACFDWFAAERASSGAPPATLGANARTTSVARHLAVDAAVARWSTARSGRAWHLTTLHLAPPQARAGSRSTRASSAKRCAIMHPLLTPAMITRAGSATPPAPSASTRARSRRKPTSSPGGPRCALRPRDDGAAALGDRRRRARSARAPPRPAGRGAERVPAASAGVFDSAGARRRGGDARPTLAAPASLEFRREHSPRRSASSPTCRHRPRRAILAVGVRRRRRPRRRPCRYPR